jgi:hypothetical protein
VDGFADVPRPVAPRQRWATHALVHARPAADPHPRLACPCHWGCTARELRIGAIKLIAPPAADDAVSWLFCHQIPLDQVHPLVRDFCPSTFGAQCRLSVRRGLWACPGVAAKSSLIAPDGGTSPGDTKGSAGVN